MSEPQPQSYAARARAESEARLETSRRMMTVPRTIFAGWREEWEKNHLAERIELAWEGRNA